MLRNTATIALCALAVIFPSCTIGQTVTGGGTPDQVPVFTGNGPSTLADSNIYDNSGNVGIGTVSPTSTLDVNGTTTIESNYSLLFGNTVCCGAGPTGSSIGSSAGWSDHYNGMFLNSNGTAVAASGGAQLNPALPSWRMALGSGWAEWPGGDKFVIGRVPAGGNYATPSVLFSVNDVGDVEVAKGITFPDGSSQTTAFPGVPQYSSCVSNSPSPLSCSCAHKLLSVVHASSGGSCTIATNSGSCTGTSTSNHFAVCCVCQ